MQKLILIALSSSLIAATACCGGPCPKAEFPDASKAEWEAVLDRKQVLKLKPRGDIAIKHDVHVLLVDVEPKKFADAFHAVMMDSRRSFGLITVNRKRTNIDKPFTLGERFQGRYSLVGALREQFHAEQDATFDEVLTSPALAEIVCAIENDMMSDYGEIFDLVLGPDNAKQFRFAYRYLEGSPIAGSSMFIVDELEPGKSRVTQIFEYQEQNQSFANFFSNKGLKLHNQVVYSQVSQSVALAGGHIIASDIPAAYRETP